MDDQIYKDLLATRIGNFVSGSRARSPNLLQYYHSSKDLRSNFDNFLYLYKQNTPAIIIGWGPHTRIFSMMTMYCKNVDLWTNVIGQGKIQELLTPLIIFLQHLQTFIV